MALRFPLQLYSGLLKNISGATASVPGIPAWTKDSQEIFVSNGSTYVRPAPSNQVWIVTQASPPIGRAALRELVQVAGGGALVGDFALDTVDGVTYLLTAYANKVWTANTPYDVGDTILDYNGNLQTVVDAGTSGNTEPVWSITSTTIDGGSASPPIPSVIWMVSQGFVAIAGSGAVGTVSSVNNIYPIAGNITLPLSRLSDVGLTSPSSGQLLSYNGSVWVNTSAPTSGINQLTGVVLAGPGTGSQSTVFGASAIATVLAPGIVKPDGTTITIDGSGKITAVGSSSGTVTSVAMTVPSILSVTGSPVTTAGTLALNLTVEAANTFFAGPVTTSPPTGVPTFRAIAPADLPIATTAALGAVYVDNTTITVTGGGEISAVTSGITQLTGDVTAGPGTGSKVATVVGFDGLPFENVPAPSTGNVIIWDGVSYTPGPATAGQAQILYLTNTSSDIGGYSVWNTSPFSSQFTYPISITSGSGETLIEAFATASGYPNVTTIPAGEWQADVYTQVSDATATTTLYLDVYKRNPGGTETLLFSFSKTISGAGTGINSYTVLSIQSAITLLTTDRLVIKYSAATTLGTSTTITLYGGGSDYYSHVHTPIGTVASGVTSVALSAPVEFTVSGSPVTSIGTLTFSKNAQSANTFYAGPATTSPPTAIPTFRSLSSADLPIATSSSLGAVYVDGTTITITGGGEISAAHNGTVTSVAMTVPARQTVTGSPVTTSGTITISDNAQSPNTFFAGPPVSSPPTAVPTFRAITSSDLPIATTGALGAVYVDGTTITVTAGGEISAAGSGTVTSVAMTVPSFLSVSGSPVTTTGTLVVTLTAESSNTVFAGRSATSPPTATPTFRSLVTGDLPANGTIRTIACVIDGGGSPPSTGLKSMVVVPFNCTITGWTIIADQSGLANVDVCYIAGSGAPPTAPNIPTLVSNRISASAPVALTGPAQSAAGGASAISTWSPTSLAQWGTVAFNLSSVTTCTRVSVQLFVTLT